MYFGSLDDACPASNMPNLVHIDESTRAAPEAIDPSLLLGAIRSVPIRPLIESILLALSSCPAVPEFRVSDTSPIDSSIFLIANNSVATPATANLRAMADCETGEVNIPIPPAASAEDPTKTNGISLNPECQAGVAVFPSSTAVYEERAGAKVAAPIIAGLFISFSNDEMRLELTKCLSSEAAENPAAGP